LKSWQKGISHKIDYGTVSGAVSRNSRGVIAMSPKAMGLFILAAIIVAASTANTWVMAPDLALKTGSTWPWALACLETAADIGLGFWLYPE
jgi:hypothetical protein